MGDFADEAIDRMCNEDEEQIRVMGTSIVFQALLRPSQCGVCGGPLARRVGPYGAFMGCAAFPKCKGGTTYSLRSVELEEEDQARMEGELPPKG